MCPLCVTVVIDIYPLVFFPPDHRAKSYAGLIGMAWLLMVAMLFSPHAHAVSALSIKADRIETTQGLAKNFKLDYGLSNANLTLRTQWQMPDDQAWTDASLTCAKLIHAAREYACEDAKLVFGASTFPFSLKLLHKPTKGMQHIDASLRVKQATFSDSAGFHAGEKVSLDLDLALQERNSEKKTPAKNTALKNASAGWDWKADVNWREGEVFWQPFYFANGGHRLNAQGKLTSDTLEISRAQLALHEIGSATFSATFLQPSNKLHHLQLSTSQMQLEKLYPLLLKPLLERTALNNLEMAGNATLEANMQFGEFKTARLDLENVDVDDRNGLFGFYKLNAQLPWSYDEPQALKLRYAGGHLQKIPLGKTDISAGINRYSLTAAIMELPILDGGLQLKDISAVWLDGGWHWHLRANILPISMSELSRALEWPIMQGKVAATIPLVTYSSGLLITDGDMQFNVFDGVITVNNLAMQTPMGVVPRLTGNLTMRNLDLGTLTRTFSFGAIEGKLDGDVNDLRLVKWKPVHFDAAVYSSPGRYTKKISQRAVENISALGGAGAAAAIQRSFLRFFDDFNYSKLGLSCQLRNDLCRMEGVESTKEGYVIVKGSGIPAITVLGYNRNVSWGELLERTKRVTAGNSSPIIK